MKIHPKVEKNSHGKKIVAILCLIVAAILVFLTTSQRQIQLPSQISKFFKFKSKSQFTNSKTIQNQFAQYPELSTILDNSKIFQVSHIKSKSLKLKVTKLLQKLDNRGRNPKFYTRVISFCPDEPSKSQSGDYQTSEDSDIFLQFDVFLANDKNKIKEFTLQLKAHDLIFEKELN